MRILQVCTTDSGGAGKSAYRLHLGLKSLNIESKILVSNRRSTDSDVIQIEKSGNIFKKLVNKLRNRLFYSELSMYKNTGYDLFSHDKTIYNVAKHPLVKKSDIIILRWIAGLIDYHKFFSNVNNKPLFWRAADMNPFTGGCHYSNGCTRYQTGCGSCPQLNSKDPNDLSRKIFKRKEKAYRNRNIHIIAISRWQAACVKKSYLLRQNPIDIIPNGVPTDIFKKRYDKSFLRKALGIPQEKTVILFGVDYKTERKGFEYLLKALTLLQERIDTRKLLLVTFGPKELLDDLSPDCTFPICHMGYINNESLLSNIYSAANFFVMPSIEEAGGQTFLEAMACEIPVVAFKTGNMADAIIPYTNGLLTEIKNFRALADDIEYMIFHPKEREQMGLNARKLVEREYSLKVQAKRYIKICKTVLTNKSESQP